MSRFRQFHIMGLTAALEEDASTEVVVGGDKIVDPTAAVDAVVDPAVTAPVIEAPAATEAPPEAAPDATEAPTATEAPAADAPADAAEVNAPASTEGAEPAAAEVSPTEVATAETVPTAVPEAEAQDATPTEGAAVEETAADAAAPAPVAEVPEATDAAGATDETTGAAESAAEATQAPADTGEATNAPASTEGGEGVVADNPVTEPAKAEDKPDDVVSLEELDAEAEMIESIQNESDLISGMADTAADEAVEDGLQAALETLEVLQENAAQLIEDGTGTEQTAQLLEDTARNVLNSVGVDMEIAAMESYGNDITIRHQLVMENLDTYADRIRQSLDINFSELIDQYIERYATYKETVSKIKRDISGLRSEWNKRKSSVQQPQHEGSLAAVRFFNVKTGEILPILKEDIKVSDYILGDYPKDIAANIEKLNAVLSSTTYKDAAGFAKFLEKVGGTEPQSKIFKEAPGGRMFALLGNYGIVRETERAPKALGYEDKTFPTLAEAARFDAYVMHQGTDLIQMLNSGQVSGQNTGAQIIGKIVIGSVTAIYDIITAQKVVLTNDEVGKLIDAADDYADACLAWCTNINRVLGVYRSLEQGMSKFSRIGSDIEKISLVQRYRAWRLLGQVKRVVRNQLRYMDIPTGKESYRAMTGARSCFYLARRFVKTAK